MTYLHLACLIFYGADSLARPESLISSNPAVSSPHLRSTTWPIEAWELSGSSSAAGEILIPAKFPGNAHLALMAAGILDEDFLYRKQELHYSWIAQTDWTFTSNFQTPLEIQTEIQEVNNARNVRDSDRVPSGCMLALSGVDAIATITLNGIELGIAKNGLS